MDESKLMQLAKLGRAMRAAQQAYFKQRSSAALEESKKLERQFDRECDEVLSNQPKLFDL